MAAQTPWLLLRRAMLLLGFVLPPLVATPAHAEEASEPARRRFGVEQALRANLGLFSALGEFGVTYSVLPLENLELEAGVGYGFTGPQLSLMPKLVLGARHHRFTSGVGLSLSYTDAYTRRGNDLVEGDRAVTWLNVDGLGYEYRSEGGLSLTVALGVTVSLSHGALRGSEAAIPLEGLWEPQVRLGIGPAF
jgi:hypothetical protein